MTTHRMLDDFLADVLARIQPNPATARYDLDQAIADVEFAAAQYVCAQLSPFLTPGALPGDPDPDTAYQDLVRAAVVVAWEVGKTAQRKAFPGPVYDDDQMAALLAGIRG